jgi:hypothetical protein
MDAHPQIYLCSERSVSSVKALANYTTKVYGRASINIRMSKVSVVQDTKRFREPRGPNAVYMYTEAIRQHEFEEINICAS